MPALLFVTGFCCSAVSIFDAYIAGAAAASGEVAGGEIAAHRVLVFAQLKSLLDLVETEVCLLAPRDAGVL